MSVLLALAVAPRTVSASPQSVSEPSPLFVAWNTEAPLRISGSKAVYPPIAAIAHVEGCVYVSFIVSTDGSIKNTTPLSGPILMFQSAMRAVSTWKFRPSAQYVLTVSPVCYFLSADKQEKLLDSYQTTAEQVANNRGKAVSFGAELYWMGLPEQAEAQFQRALSLTPGDPEAEFDLGDSLVAEGRFDDAIAAYRQCLTTDPKYLSENARQQPPQHDDLLRQTENNGPLLYALGQVYEKKGDRKHALRLYRDAMKLMPYRTDFREAFNRLAGR
jgi:hypothetical protein